MRGFRQSDASVGQQSRKTRVKFESRREGDFQQFADRLPAFGALEKMFPFKRRKRALRMDEIPYAVCRNVSFVKLWIPLNRVHLCLRKSSQAPPDSG